MLKLREACGIPVWRKPGAPWPHDVLRHPFGFSRLAIHENRPLPSEIMCNPLNSNTLKYKRTLSVAQAEALFFIMPSKGKSRTGWGSKESPLRSGPGAIVVVKTPQGRLG